MGGGNIEFPDPHEVGRAQFAWNNLNQTTPYGSVEYAPPELDQYGNPISSGSMTQTLDPELMALQESMLGLRSSALSRLGSMFGGAGGSGGFGGLTNPASSGSSWFMDYGGNGAGVGANGGWNNPPGEYMDENLKMGTKIGEDPSGRYGPGYDFEGPPGGNGQPIGDTRPRGFPGSSFQDTAHGGNPLWYSDNAPALKTGVSGGLPDLLGAGDLEGERARVTQAKFDRMKGLLDPVFAEKNTALQEQMANRGMPVGAEEYSILSDQLGQQESNAYTNAALEADLAGGNELSRLAGLSGQQRGQLFGEQMTGANLSNQARQQAFGENMGVNDALMRSMLGMGSFGMQQQQQEYNQLASLLGLTQAPGAGGDLSQFYGPSPVDMMGAYNMNQQGQMHNASNEISSAGLMSGLFGLGGSAMGMAGALSSVKVKENFEEIDHNAILEAVEDLDVTRWNYQWDTPEKAHIGPMAEDFAEKFNVHSEPIAGIKTLDTVSTIGVLLSAVKALAGRVRELEEK